MILIAIPHKDFDPTEAAVPWSELTQAGHQVRFATPTGRMGEADQRVLTGRGFGPLRPFFAATRQSFEVYEELRGQEPFQSPISYEDVIEGEFDGLLLPGGHAAGMKEYLESKTLQDIAASFFVRGKPVGAICHGVIVLARARMPESEKSPLFGRKTTALPAFMELAAYWSTRLWLGDYFKTYGETVQQIVCRELENGADFLSGPRSFRRDSPESPEKGFSVTDRNYVSARWPGDVYRFSRGFLEILKNYLREAP